LSSCDPLYTRREQIRESDVTFLRGLCEAAGVSLKCTAKMLVLFDGEDYESKDAVFTVVKGDSGVKTYTLDTGLNDTAYSSCRVSYTDPATGSTIEYTYTPQGGNGSGQILEVNEKVTTREEARQLAMKRLRQKNKRETAARFTLVGNAGIAAGCTVSVKGYGMFDGKYIIDAATHNVTGSGYTTEISCTKALEGY
ncbi:MAG: contractile injection system protein, VgrG/Pvc8 family, partial [Eubacterium sp.]|nr:contractile injection system protein, VgrG/Pvc8 family [Eubacterium sp.]